MELRVLGGLRLDGADFRREKPLVLLAYLALEGPRERAHLAELFWPDAANPAASAAKALSQLRGVAPELLREGDGRVEADVPTDAQAFLEAVAAGRAEEALARYEGPFLDGVRLPWGVELEEWVYAQREALAAHARGAMVRLAEWHAARGAFDAAADLAERAYLLRGAPEPDEAQLTRLHALLDADERPLAADVRKEAAAFDLALEADRDAARTALQAREAGTDVVPPNPYLGLAHFREEDAADFHGREAFTEALRRAVREPPHVVAVVGPSGCGKSSVLFAGLLPALRAESGWRVAAARPGRRPYASLAHALAPLLEEGLDEVARLERAEALATALRAGTLTVGAVIDRALQRHPGARLLLAVDGLEELYTLAEGDAPAPFDPAPLLDGLLAAAQHLEGRFTLAATLRADYLGRALEHRPLAAVMRAAQHPLGPMDEEELRAAIEAPARAAGAAFEEGLVERIVRDVGGRDGALPLVQFALDRLWRHQRRGVLTHAGYEAVGGVEDAIANHAERVYGELAEDEQAAAQAVLLQLVQPGAGLEDTRRVARLEELGTYRGVVEKLAAPEARLLVTGRDEAGARTVEVTHEALLRRWARLRRWVDAHRAFRAWQERLREDVRLWLEHGRDPSALLHGFRLDEAERMLARHEAWSSDDERAFVRAGVEARARARAEERQRREAQARGRRERERLQRRVARVLTVALAVAVTLSGLTLWQWRTAASERSRALAQRDLAQQQVRLTLSRQLAAQALTAAQAPGPLNGNYDRALLLAAEAAALDAGSAESHANLLRVLGSVPSRLAGFLAGPGRPVSSLAFGTDGRLLATDASGEAILAWEVDEPRAASRPLRGHEGGVRSVAFAPDGRRLASGGRDGRVFLWDVANGEPVGPPLQGHDDEVLSVAFAPDGDLLASAGRDGRIVLWDVGAGRQLGSLVPEGRTPVTSLAFGPEGVLLASGHRDNAVTLWDVPSRAVRGDPLYGHDDQVRAVAVSPEGRLVASGSRDGTVVLWDASDGTRVGAPLDGHPGEVRAVAFSPDGTQLASAGSDGAVVLWDVARGTRVGEPLRAHTDEVRGLAYSPDGALLASASNDASVILWNVSDRTPLGAPLRGHEGSVWSVAFAPDGGVLATGSQDGTVRLWDVEGPTDSAVPLGAPPPDADAADGPPLEAGEPLAVAVGPGGRLLASGGRDDAVRLWDLARRAPAGPPLRGHDDWVRALAFNADGRLLASGSDDGTVRLWDVATGQARGAPLRGHTDAVRAVAFGPGGQLLASAGADGTVRLWDVATGEALGAPLRGHEDWVTDLAFAPAGELLASAGRDGHVRLWDVPTGEAIGAPLGGDGAWVSAVAFSPDGAVLASGSRDGTVLLWDADTRRPLGELARRSGEPVYALAFAPDGDRLATGHGSGSVVLWTVGFEALRARACALAGRGLDRAEWRRYLGERAFEPSCGGRA